MSKTVIWAVIRAAAIGSNCLKTKTGAGLVKDGRLFSTGFNICAPKPHNYGDILGSCPRLNIKTGTQYELCSPIHAEVMVCLNIRPGRIASTLAMYVSQEKLTYNTIRAAFTTQELQVLEGSELYLSGHYWVCGGCLSFLKAVGVKRVVFEDLTGMDVE